MFGPQTLVRPGATAIIGVVGPRGKDGNPGAQGGVGPAPWAPPVSWQTGLVCVIGPPATYVTVNGGSFVCLAPHSAGIFSQDLAAGYWAQVSAPGANGAVWFVATVVPSPFTGNVGDLFLNSTTGDVYQKTANGWGTPVANLKGVQGAAGAAIQNGSGAPSAAVGNNGDFYLDTTNTRLYGPKSAGAWPNTYAALIGAAGTNGNTIQNGSGAPASGLGVNGDFYIDTANSRLYGPKAAGAWPGTYVSLIGPSGNGSGNVNTSGTPTAGQVAYFPGGSGNTISPGASAIAAGAGLTGGGDFTASRTLSLSWPVNAQTGTTYTVQASDGFKLVKLSNAAAVAVTLPAAGASFPNGWETSFLNLGAGTVTITPASGTINGVASLTLTTGQSADVYSDGTNYFAAAGSAAASNSGGSGFPSTFATKSAAYTVVSTDKNTLFALTGSATLTLPSASSFGAGNGIYLSKTDGNGVWAVTPASGTVDGLSSINVYQERFALVSDGTNWRSVNRPKGWIPIGSATVSSAVAAINFTVGFGDAELRDMGFDGENLALSAADYPILRVQKSGTYQSSGYTASLLYQSGTSVGGASIANGVALNFDNATNPKYFDAAIMSFASTTNQFLTANGYSTSTYQVTSRGVQTSVSAAVTGAQFINNTGANFMSGTINQRGFRP